MQWNRRERECIHALLLLTITLLYLPECKGDFFTVLHDVATNSQTGIRLLKSCRHPWTSLGLEIRYPPLPFSTSELPPWPEKRNLLGAIRQRRTASLMEMARKHVACGFSPVTCPSSFTVGLIILVMAPHQLRLPLVLSTDGYYFPVS